MNTQERSQTPECMEKMRAAKETRSASTLSECSQNRGSYCSFSGLGDCPNNLILPFPSPQKVPTRTYERIPQMDYSDTWASHSSPRACSRSLPKRPLIGWLAHL